MRLQKKAYVRVRGCSKLYRIDKVGIRKKQALCRWVNMGTTTAQTQWVDVNLIRKAATNHTDHPANYRVDQCTVCGVKHR